MFDSKYDDKKYLQSMSNRFKRLSQHTKQIMSQVYKSLLNNIAFNIEMPY